MKLGSWTLTIFLLLIGVLGKAQKITPGNWFAGGSLSFISQQNSFPLTGLSAISGIGGVFSNSTENSQNRTFSTTTFLGHTISPHLTAGIQFDYQHNTFSVWNATLFGFPEPVDTERKATQQGVGVFVRYTLQPDHAFQFFLQPAADINRIKANQKQNGNLLQEEKASYFEADLALGLLYNLNDSFRLTFKLGALKYIIGNWEILNTTQSKSFSAFSTNLNLANALIGFEIKW